jgi:NitT/TauT family transport system substrate-binding protein
MKRFLSALFLLLALPASACLMSTAADAAGASTHITFVTDWKAQAEHGGFYEALAEGLYAKYGLDVTIREGGPDVNVPQLLAGGAADFGIGSNAFVVMNLVQQKVPLRAVMAIFQKDPQVLISHPRHDMNSLAEMKGHPILISAAGTTSFWPWLRAKYGFQDSQIRKYTNNLAPFLVDPNAIQEGYLTSEPYTIEQQAHFTPKVFLLSDYGYPGYANMVLTTQKWIDTNPDVVQKFFNASKQGWLDYLNRDPKPGNALIKRDNPDMTDAIIAQSIAKMKQYQLVAGGDAPAYGLGAMTDKSWRDFSQIMTSQGLYPKGLDVTKAYDLRFQRHTLQNFQ